MLLAGWFAAKGTLDNNNLLYLRNITERLGFSYGYGVDEVILTELFLNPTTPGRSRLMTRKNTNITYLFNLGALFRLIVGFQDEPAMNYIRHMAATRWRRECPDPTVALAMSQALRVGELQSLEWVVDQLGRRWSDCLQIEKDCIAYFEARRKEFIRQAPLEYSKTFKKLNDLMKNAYFTNVAVPNLVDPNAITGALGVLPQEEDETIVTAIMSVSSLSNVTFPGFAFKTKRFEDLYRHPAKKRFLLRTLREDVLES
jgi:hypothetical protein